MVTKSTTLSALALVASLTLAGASQAQPPPPGAPGRPAATQPPAVGPVHAQMQQRMTERRAQRVQDLSTVLRLRPDQRPALDAFLASQAARPDGRNRADRSDRRNLTTPQRLDEQARRMQERQTEITRRTQALRTFYAALSTDQQQVFDALARLRGGRGDGARDGGRRMMRMGGPGMGAGMAPGFPPAPPAR